MEGDGSGGGGGKEAGGGTSRGNTGNEVDWELLPELLDGGQGKDTKSNITKLTEQAEGTLQCKGGDQRDEGALGSQSEEGEGNQTQTAWKWETPEGLPPQSAEWNGLEPPRIQSSGCTVTGQTKEVLRRQSARERRARLALQRQGSQWKTHVGECVPSISESMGPHEHRGGMCPQGLALQHPAAPLLKEWAQFGCPAMTGRDWTVQEMTEVVERGPHESALTSEAIQHFAAEVLEKVATGQAKIVDWDDIKDDPPPQLKISPVAAIPHKSKAFRTILDLSFRLRLKEGGVLLAVNDTSTKTAPKGAIDQIGHALKRIIHAFAEAEEEDKIFMAKWDIKDGFWRLQCREGEEWNFAYVLPRQAGKPAQLVVPTSLQMGWIESPPYFCVASETAGDVAAQYIEATVGELPVHKLEHYTVTAQENMASREEHKGGGFKYVLEVYVDDFMSLVIPTSADHLRHVANAVMKGIHDVFPEDSDDEKDPISVKKLRQGDGRYSTKKCILGFDFDGEAKTLWLEEEKRALLLTILHGWIRGARRAQAGIQFKEFESVTAKLRHAFTAIPAGKGLLSPCNWVLRKRPEVVYFHSNNGLLQAIMDARTLL